jgi:putative GTP pyrophosphokinase
LASVTCLALPPGEPSIAGDRMVTSKNLRAFRAQYEAIQPRATRLLDELTRQVSTLLLEAKIDLAFPIEKRIKSWDSIVNKRRRHGFRVSTIDDLNDLCGMRIITLFKRDSEEIAEQIARRFIVISEDDAATRLRDDRFGYASIHLVIAIPDSWRAVPTLVDLVGLKAEIQVRSTAQHLWAATSHVLQYKTEESVPPPVRRSLSRVSALLELVDLELTRVVEQRAGYRELLPTQVTTVLNTDSLEGTLDTMLPAANKDEDELYHVLLEELLHFEIDTPLKLRSVLRKHMGRILNKERETVEGILARGPSDFEDEERVVRKGVYFSHSGLVGVALSFEFGIAWQEYMKTQSAYLAKYYPLEDEVEP